jgi:hypothetical protein
MGPISLFDKSFLQSLSLDEAVWFDRFFMPVACPIFFAETLGDLGKDPSKRGSAEFSVAKDIAQKFPELGGSPCTFHVDIATHDLLGSHMPMDGRIPRSGGRPVPKGVVCELGPEERAFSRWQNGEFHEVEKIVAAQWRQALSQLDLNKVASELRSVGIDGKLCKSLDQARDMALTVVSNTTHITSVLALAVIFLHVPQHLHPRILEAWQREGCRPLNIFAPYAAHVVAVELFFQFALAARLIGSNRPSNRTDIAYLFYLPFCSLFISSDDLHRRSTHLFTRPNQEFVWGVDLKAGLRAVNAHFLQLPEHVREKGVMSFAHAPPDGNIVADLWDRHLRPGYRTKVSQPRDPPPKRDPELLKRLKEFSEQQTVPPDHAPEADTMEMMSIKRSVHRKRGSWWQVPKDMPDPKETDK